MTLAASRKSTPCLLRLAAAFAGSHLKITLRSIAQVAWGVPRGKEARAVGSRLTIPRLANPALGAALAAARKPPARPVTASAVTESAGLGEVSAASGVAGHVFGAYAADGRPTSKAF